MLARKKINTGITLDPYVLRELKTLAKQSKRSVSSYLQWLALVEIVKHKTLKKKGHAL